MLEMEFRSVPEPDATGFRANNPYLSLYWLITGKTIGGLGLFFIRKRTDWIGGSTQSSTPWGAAGFQPKTAKKERLLLASWLTWLFSQADYFSIPEEEISISNRSLQSWVGRSSMPADEFSKLAPPATASEPKLVSSQGIWRLREGSGPHSWCISPRCLFAYVAASPDGGTRSHLQVLGEFGLWGLGCDCFAF